MDGSIFALPDALLEREHEVERIGAALRSAGQRAGRVVIVEAAAGLVKSRLLEEARREAPGLGVCSLSARATELEQGFPFGVMRQLFERRLLEAESGERDRWLAGAAALAADVLIAAPAQASRGPAAGAPPGDPGYAWQHGLYWLASNLSGRFAARAHRRRFAVVRCALSPRARVRREPTRRTAAWADPGDAAT